MRPCPSIRKTDHPAIAKQAVTDIQVVQASIDCQQPIRMIILFIYLYPYLSCSIWLRQLKYNINSTLSITLLGCAVTKVNQKLKSSFV